MIDIHENFQRQSYRNRCEILTANGTTPLTVNTISTSNWDKATVKETRIDYSKKWQHRHWQSLLSSYKNSPYFDFFYHKFEPFYNREYEFLLDFNLGLMKVVLKLLDSDAKIVLSDDYIEVDPSRVGSDTPKDVMNFRDYRDVLSPKPRLIQPDPYFTPKPYWQVFGDRFEFQPNLSIVDLIFCEGPSALSILRQSHLKE